MPFERNSGILLHPTSLPSPFGIGDLGPWAYRFADFLAAARQTYWQLLPLTVTSSAHGNSPYDSPSAFAGNPLLVSPELLVDDGLLRPQDLEERPRFDAARVDYDAAAAYKARLFDKAYERFQARGADAGFEKFSERHAGWLDDYSLFAALKAHFEGAPWTDWPPPLRDRDRSTLAQWKKKCRERTRKEQWLQYLFFKQWSALKEYANNKKILFIGDMPIYVSGDSADVWANPQLFKLDHEKRPTAVAGVPPDYFSATGQLWGNPVYRWDVLNQTGHKWWLKRLRHNLSCFDRVRLDHFRGFAAHWEIPADEPTAVKGSWQPGPGANLFDTLLAKLGKVPFIAEDLGLVTPEVKALRDRFGFPGIKILQFAFGTDPNAPDFLPHNYPRNAVVYTGTHDNDTTVGWWESLDAATRANVEKYFGPIREGIHWAMIRAAMASTAAMTIIPLQDVLGLGTEARMNTPSKTTDNWGWRYQANALKPALAAKLAAITEITDREPVKSAGSPAAPLEKH